jgi:hypothetical protein
VHLFPCSPPNGSLEPAPRTSLRSDSAQEQWQGFWCVADDRYYARCLSSDGSVQWHRYGDEPAKRRWDKHVRGPTYVSVRRPSSVDTHDAPRTLTRVARRTLTQAASRTLTLDARRTVLVGKFGQRAFLVRLVRRRRARSAR